jgi:hypothetical protein
MYYTFIIEDKRIQHNYYMIEGMKIKGVVINNRYGRILNTVLLIKILTRPSKRQNFDVLKMFDET